MSSWLKKLQRFFRRSQHKISEQSIKREISGLEREREKEHRALLRQRRFYERLLHRNKPVPSILKKEEKREVPHFQVTPPPKVELKPILAPEIKPEPVMRVEKNETPPPPVIAPKIETIVEKKIETPPQKKPQQNFFAHFFKSFAKKNSLAKKLAEERKQEEAVKHKNEVEERFWQPYNSVKANLIKDQGVLFFNWKQRLLTLSLALVLSSLAIGLVYVGLLIWQKERLRDNESTLANFEAINAEISKNEREIQDIVAFNRKLDVVSFILSNHVYWSNFFKFLEANTLKDVYFEKFTGDLTGQYMIPAVSRNLDAASAQLEVMKAYPLVRNVQYLAGQTVADSTGDGQRTKFNLEISVDPKIFIK